MTVRAVPSAIAAARGGNGSSDGGYCSNSCNDSNGRGAVIAAKARPKRVR